VTGDHPRHGRRESSTPPTTTNSNKPRMKDI